MATCLRRQFRCFAFFAYLVYISLLQTAGLQLQLGLHLVGMETCLGPVCVFPPFPPCWALVAFTCCQTPHTHTTPHLLFPSTVLFVFIPLQRHLIRWTLGCSSLRVGGALKFERPDYNCITGPRQQYIKWQCVKTKRNGMTIMKTGCGTTFRTLSHYWLLSSPQICLHHMT